MTFISILNHFLCFFFSNIEMHKLSRIHEHTMHLQIGCRFSSRTAFGLILGQSLHIREYESHDFFLFFDYFIFVYVWKKLKRRRKIEKKI